MESNVDTVLRDMDFRVVYGVPKARLKGADALHYLTLKAT